MVSDLISHHFFDSTVEKPHYLNLQCSVVVHKDWDLGLLWLVRCNAYYVVIGPLQDEDSEAVLAADFEIGHFIRERIVPRAVLYFTGEAIEDDDDDVSAASNAVCLSACLNVIHTLISNLHKCFCVCGVFAFVDQCLVFL